MSTLPFLAVTATSDKATHLVVASPALRSSRPDHLPFATLCGRAVDQEDPTPIGEVECARCVLRTPKFMGLPAYAVTL
jgi:hypothetical protein